MHCKAEQNANSKKTHSHNGLHEYICIYISKVTKERQKETCIITHLLDGTLSDSSAVVPDHFCGNHLARPWTNWQNAHSPSTPCLTFHLGCHWRDSLARVVSGLRRWGSSMGISLWIMLTLLARGLPSSFWTFSTMSYGLVKRVWSREEGK